MKHRTLHSLFYSVLVIEGVAALIFLFLIPSEGGRISPARLALISILLAMSLLWAYLGLKHPFYLNRFARPFYIAVFAILSFVLCLVLFLLRYLNPEELQSVYERLSPFLLYFILLFIQLSFFLLYSYKGFFPARLSQYKPVYHSAIIVLFILTGVFVLVIKTRLGITFDPAFWGEPGIPIPAWQFVLALIIGVFVFILTYFLRSPLLDVLLPTLIYLIALVIWLSVPVEVIKDSYYMRISKPDFQPYPYADSAYYDQMSQSVLIGHPYQKVIPTRPLYIFFLTILHIMFGQDYPKILAAQTVVLASIPVLLYLLGKKLHSRAAGTITASFFVFREWTSLLVSSDTRVTNTKMILVDLPTLLLLLIACWLSIRWLESRNIRNAFLAGGMFGVVLLLRTQSFFIMPLIILFALLIARWKKITNYRQIVIFIIGFAIAIAPWLLHNYLLTGKVTFDADFQLFNTLAGQYRSPDNPAAPNQNPATGIIPILVDSLISDPSFVLGFITNHFLAIQVNGMLIFPIFEKFNGLFQPPNLYWMRWESGENYPQWNSILLLYLYLVVISIGFGSVWRRWQWLGLLPLAFSAGYAVATAISRFSGWRYDFPSDWVWYFYFGIGFVELVAQIATLFGTPIDSSDSIGSKPDGPGTSHRIMTSLVPLGILFLLIGSLPWGIKRLYPPRYSDQSSASLSARVASITDTPPQTSIDTFIAQPNAIMEFGRLLYPRFFNRGKGLTSANPVPAYAIRDYPRIGFILLNQTSQSVVFPSDDIPGPVPHAGDVIILGCQRDSYIEARLIAFPELDIYYVRPSFSYPCSP